MAELNSNEEPHVLPSKRKQTAPDADAESAKKQQVENCADNETSAAVEEKIVNENGEEEEDEEEDYDGEDDADSEDEEDDEDEDDDEVEHSNGVDRKGKGIMKDDKGKGIMKDDKGKGKLIEESEDEDSSDDDGGSESDGDDDLSDDPLAEVDLDNILPSRTRRRTAPPGVRFSNDKDNDA